MNYSEDNYVALIENFNYWENKNQYLILMKKFIDKKIDGRQFDRKFCQMWRFDRDRDKNYSSKELFNKIKDLELIKLNGFSSLKLSSICTKKKILESLEERVEGHISVD